MVIQLILIQLEEGLKYTYSNTPSTQTFPWLTSWLICVPTKESLFLSKAIRLFRSGSILNVVMWNKHWLAPDTVLEPSRQAWTVSISVLLQLWQLRASLSLFLGFACPSVMAGRQSSGERSKEPPAANLCSPLTASLQRVAPSNYKLWGRDQRF